ncbi:MAG: hypothetical protein ACRDBM_07015 [Sporomusa sp.]
MTAKELSQLYYLNREIDRDKRTLAELEAAATSSTTKITGLPHAGGMSDKPALTAEIADVRNIIGAKNKQCIAEYNRLMRYINSVEDSLMRQIITLRNVNGLPWRQIAFSLAD